MLVIIDKFSMYNIKRDICNKVLILQLVGVHTVHAYIHTDKHVTSGEEECVSGAYGTMPVVSSI